MQEPKEIILEEEEKDPLEAKVSKPEEPEEGTNIAGQVSDRSSNEQTMQTERRLKRELNPEAENQIKTSIIPENEKLESSGGIKRTFRLLISGKMMRLNLYHIFAGIVLAVFGGFLGFEGGEHVFGG